MGAGPVEAEARRPGMAHAAQSRALPLCACGSHAAETSSLDARESPGPAWPDAPDSRGGLRGSGPAATFRGHGRREARGLEKQARRNGRQETGSCVNPKVHPVPKTRGEFACDINMLATALTEHIGSDTNLLSVQVLEQPASPGVLRQ